MKVIALTGRAGSGKDTAGQLLQFLTDKTDWIGEVHPVRVEDLLWKDVFTAGNDFCTYQIAKFAYPVYQIVAIILGRPVDAILLDPNFKNTVQYRGLTGRQLLQKVGTECFREVLGKHVWADVMHEHLNNLAKLDVEGVFITDLRFLNEHEVIKSWNGTTIRLDGRDSGVLTDHPSESELEKIPWDVRIDNSLDLPHLFKELEDFCRVDSILNNQYIITDAKRV